MPLLAMLTWAAVGFPLLVAVSWAVPALRNSVVRLVPFAALPALVLTAVHMVDPGAIQTQVAPMLVLGVSLGLDALGGVMLALTAFLWTIAGLYARTYHRSDPRRASFFAFFSATLAGNIGLVLAADLLSFYLFFTLMTFAGWGLVIHRRSQAAIAAGRVYIVLAVIGEVAILAALFTLAAAAPGALGSGFDLQGAWLALDAWAPLVAGLAIAGFGVKAGMVPLHVWLPLAHPVAPTAASAMLSGVMLKAGLLGWLRVLPDTSAVSLPWVGEALLLLGIVGIFYGVIVGLAQEEPKTILAYSSVSQMGYLSVGTGLLILMSAPGASAVVMGFIMLQMLNHGLAKAALFLAVGVADNLPQARTARFWRTGTLLPALALSGVPLTAGYVSKGALKDSLSAHGGWPYGLLTPLLPIAAFGTAILLVRFAVRVEHRLAARPANASAAQASFMPAPSRAPWGLTLPWAILVLVGASAPLWLFTLIAPVTGTWLAPVVDLAPRDWLAALLPIVLAVAVGWAIHRYPRLIGGLADARVPAGDVLVVIEFIRGRMPGVAGALADATGAAQRAGETAERAVIRRHDRLMSGDLVLMRGPVLAVMVIVLVLLLGLFIALSLAPSVAL